MAGVGSFLASFVSSATGASTGGISMSPLNRRKNERPTTSVQSSPSNDVDRLSMYLDGEFQRIKTNASQSTDPEIDKPLDTIDIADTVGALTTLDKNIRIVDDKVRSMDSTLRNTVSLMEYNKRLLEKTISTMNDMRSQSNYKRFSDLENKLESRKEPYLDDETLSILEKRISEDLSKKFGGGGSSGVSVVGAAAAEELGAAALGGAVGGGLLSTLGGMAIRSSALGLIMSQLSWWNQPHYSSQDDFKKKMAELYRNSPRNQKMWSEEWKRKYRDFHPQDDITQLAAPEVIVRGNIGASGSYGGSTAFGNGTATLLPKSLSAGYGENATPWLPFDLKSGKYPPRPGFETLPFNGNPDYPVLPYIGYDPKFGKFPAAPGFQTLPFYSANLLASGGYGGGVGISGLSNPNRTPGSFALSGSYGTSTNGYGSALLEKQIASIIAANGSYGASTDISGSATLGHPNGNVYANGRSGVGTGVSAGSRLNRNLGKMNVSGFANAGAGVMGSAQTMLHRLESITGTLHAGVTSSGIASITNPNALLTNGSARAGTTGASGHSFVDGTYYSAKQADDKITEALRKSYEQMITLYTNAGRMDKANEIRKKLDALNGQDLGVDTQGPSYDQTQSGSFLPMAYKQYTDGQSSSDRTYQESIQKINASKVAQNSTDIVADFNRYEISSKYMKVTGATSFESYSDTLYYVHSKQDIVLRAPNITLIGNVKNVQESGSSGGSVTQASFEMPGSTGDLSSGATDGPRGGLGRGTGGNGGGSTKPPQTGSWLPTGTFKPVGASAVPTLGSGTRAQQAYAFFKSKGWSDVQAAGIVGNLMHESNLNTGIVGDGGAAIGIAQWHSPRQANFERLYGHPVGQGTYEEQLAFVQWELEHSHKFAGNALKGATTVEQATASVQQFYEAPKSLTASIDARTNNARSVMSAGAKTNVSVAYNDSGSGLGVKPGVASGWVNPAVTAKLAANAATWKNPGNLFSPLPKPAPLVPTGSSAASTGEHIMLGDSIGVGMASAGRMKSFAKIGAFTSEVLGQMSNVPDGSSVYISAGTNDAHAGKTSLQKNVDDILAYAAAHKINVTWVGPPPVKTKWNDQSTKLDSWFSTYLNGKAKYISLQNPTVGSMVRAGDGIHFTGGGYASLFGMVSSSNTKPQGIAPTNANAFEGVKSSATKGSVKPVSPIKTWQTQAMEKAAELKTQSKPTPKIVVQTPQVPQSTLKDTTPNTHDGVNMSAGALPNYAASITA